MRLSRRRFAQASLASIAAAGRLPAAAPPKLVVWLIAEQFRSDYLDRYSSLFGRNGFRRMMAEGACFSDCRVNASTFSASSLATLATGAYPDVHGIVADRWFDRAEKRVTEATPELLRAPALSEEVLAADPANRVLALGLDRPAASLVSPGSKTHVYSLEAVPSEVDQPVWLSAVRASHGAARVSGGKWLACRASEDSQPLRVLLEDPGRPEEFRALFRSSPFAQSAQFEMLRAMVTEERLGLGEGITLAPVVLSSTAWLGYEQGGDSALMRDLVLHLDVEIEKLIEFLEREPGAGNYALAFTAAHGAPPLPDAAIRPSLAVSSDAVAKVVNDTLSAQYDAPNTRTRYVERYVYPFLYLRAEPLKRYNARSVRHIAAEAALRVPGVAAYFTADGDCSRGGVWLDRFRNSFHASRSGDVMLAYEPGAIEAFGARGVSYGSLYNYDVRVPALFFGRAIRAGSHQNRIESVDIVPTLARLMNVAPPAASVGEVLESVFAVEMPRK